MKHRWIASPLLTLMLIACGGGPSYEPLTHSAMSSGKLQSIDYGGFSLLYDCDARSAIRFKYRLGKDASDLARPANYTFDPTLPKDCGQQTSTNSYASVVSGWERGHLVASNHMDFDANYLLRANYMANIVPQLASVNRGVWKETENITECYRELAPINVSGGVVYDDTNNDFFVVSHGIKSPDFFWKTLTTTDAGGNLQTISWLIPNREGLGGLDSYIVTVDQIEKLIGTDLIGSKIENELKYLKPAKSWALPKSCQIG
jgi:endonuclease G